MASFRIKVGCKPEEAFAYVSDLTRHPEFANKNASLKIENVSGGAPAVGSKYRSEQLFLKKPTSADLMVTAYEPSSRFAFSVNQHMKKDTPYEQTFTFAPTDGGTLITKTVGGGGFAATLAYPAIRADAMAQLKNLKAKLESGTR